LIPGVRGAGAGLGLGAGADDDESGWERRTREDRTQERTREL